MLVDLTALAPSIFLSKNYLNRHAYNGGQLSVSSGDSFKHRLFDMDPASYWTSLGSDDVTNETIEFQLWQAGGQTMREVDFIGVFNHNIKKMKIETSDDNGITWTTRYDLDNITETDTRVNTASLYDADRVRFTLYTTQTADQEKQIGDIVIAAATFQASLPPTVYNRKAPRVSHKTASLGDDSIRRAYVFRSDASYHFYETTMGFALVPESERQDFRAVLLGRNEFLWYPEPGDRTGDIFLCQAAPGTYQDNYQSNNKNSGYMIAFDLEELGGA